MISRVVSISFLAALVLGAASACGQPQDEPNLIPKLEQLADTGNAEALYHLGMAYHVGAGVPEDHRKALDYFRRATQLGDPLAAYKLGCYYDGQGGDLVAFDADQALRYKLTAARAGYALAQQDVAKLYADRGDIDDARTWLARAAAQGTADALMAFASVHNGVPGFTKDAAVTAAYFTLFLKRSGGTADQRDWLKNFESGLSASDRQRQSDMVTRYQARPTPLTIKALRGQQSAEELVRRSH